MPDQPGGDIFVAEITEIGTELGESGSGSGVGFIPHGWKEKFLDPPTRKYIDNPLGRTGTTTVNPAFDINGAVVSVGTLVWMRLRGWNVWHQQYVYDIIAKGGGSSDEGTGAECIQKVLVSLCWQGSTLKQIFNIQQGCKILSTSCEDVPNCGSGCGSGSPTLTTCPCSDVAPLYQTFTLSTITDNGCTWCNEVMNGNWCLLWRNPIAAFTSQNNGCYYAGSPPNPLEPGFNCLALGAGVGAPVALLNIFSDGTASIQFMNAPGQPLHLIAYYTSAWDCTGSNVLTLVPGDVDPICSGWPSTLTLTPAADASSCAGSASADCASCGHTNSGTFTVTISGVTDGTCTGCNSITGSIVLNNISTCQWSASAGSITCGGVFVAPFATLIDNGSTGWELTFSGIANYFCPYSSWNCGGDSTMALVSNSTQCNWPATVTVHDNG